MKQQNIVRYTGKQMETLQRAGKSRTDWDALRTQGEQADSDVISPAQFAKAILHQALPPPKQKTRLTLRLDSDILDWFKSHGRGYQTRINALLRAYKDAHVESQRR
jgi:uncharacterized protein (DUF4415 family)